MKKTFTLLAALAAGWAAAWSQDCTGGRYYTEIFSTLDSAFNVTYGQAPGGQSLEFDVWSPAADAETDRPVIILAHGGSFVAGNKEDLTIRALCRHYARMGYVAVSMEYRLLQFTEIAGSTDLEATFLNHVYKSVHDQMALIRFLRKSEAEDGDPYKINPGLIIVGGISAGSILSMHTAYMDSPAKLPAAIDQNGDGGFYGASGNPGYSSVPQAVINYCGALKDSFLLETGDQPFVSVHGTADEVVPYGTDFAEPFPGMPITEISGSGTLHTRALNTGIDNPLLTYPGRGHCEFWTSAAQTDSTTQIVDDFLEEQLCVKHLYEAANPGQLFISIYPNPADGSVYLDLPDNKNGMQVTIVNALGAVVYNNEIQAGQYMLQLSETARLASGIYWVKVSGNGRSASKKLIIQH